MTTTENTTTAPVDITTPAPMGKNDIVSFTTMAVLKGKGVSSEQKVTQFMNNGAELGALLAAGVQPKATKALTGKTGVSLTVHELAFTSILKAAAVVSARSAMAASIMIVNGQAPYSEWLRLGAELKGKPQTTPKGKLTNAAKGYALWLEYHEAAAALRAERHAARMLQQAGLPAPAADAPAADAPAADAPAADAPAPM